MFRCENCGTGFNATVASVSETCPRCKANGTEARLTFRLFEAADRDVGSGEADVEVQKDAATPAP
jgi:hypothetical protein